MAIFLNFVVKTALIWLVLGGFFCVFSQSETICNLHSCYKFCTHVTNLHSELHSFLSQSELSNFFVYIFKCNKCLMRLRRPSLWLFCQNIFNSICPCKIRWYKNSKIFESCWHYLHCGRRLILLEPLCFPISYYCLQAYIWFSRESKLACDRLAISLRPTSLSLSSWEDEP